jgi:hypothetical protein
MPSLNIIGRAHGGNQESCLQRVQVCQQILDLLIGEHICETLHFASANPNNLGNPIIVRRHTARRKVGFLKDVFEAWPLAFPRRIGRMAAITILVI